MYYLYKDHLGSITTITNQSGAVVERHSFDAWGRLRNPQNWNFNNVSAMTLLDRGYTGHEHLTLFGLINMNGRMYDPLLGQMLSPDPYVQDIAGSQGFNRYSYCLNNPLKYTDPSGEYAWFIPVIVGVIAGGVNLAANWDNVEGFWDGAATFFTGAGAGVAACFTGGMSFWAGAGIMAGSSALVGFNNDIVRQTDKNFKGFGDINWGEVGVSTAASGVGGFAAYGAGYWAAQSPVINSIRNPLLKSTVLAPIGSAAGHIAGGTAAGVLSGQDFDIAFGNSFRGLGSSMALGTVTSLVTTAAVSRAQGINPWNGKSISNNRILTDNGIYGTQKGLNQGVSDQYLEQMRNGTFDLKNEIGGFKADGKYYIGEGHHRINAALRYYQETGNAFYIEYLIRTGNWTPANPTQYGLKIYKID